MSTGTAALIVSTISAGFTLGGLLWQFALYRLSGSRLNVQMVPVIAGVEGGIVHGHPAGWTKKKPPPDFLSDFSQWSVDLAMIRVTNVGRTAVSTEEVQIDFGRPKLWNRFRGGAAGRPIPIRTGQTSNDQHRLEPGEAIRVYFDLWPIVAEARRRRPHGVILRGSVRAVSRRATLSPRRHAWVIAPDQVRLQPELEIEPEIAAYHEFWRSLVHEENFFEKEYSAWLEVRSQLRAEKPAQDVANTFESHFGPGRSFAAMQIVDIYRGSPAGEEQ